VVFGERIRVDGVKISQDYVIDFVEKNRLLFDEIKPSFFEATMAMAFRYFADCEVDVAVIEVGLGGRLDSTNIIHPELSVITNISFDHIQFLGNTLAEIAGEKAGIIKPKTPVVIGEVLADTFPVFIKKANEENAPVVFAEQKQSVKFVEYTEDKMIVDTAGYEKLNIGLCGEYQLKNIATVLTALQELQKQGFAIYEDDIRAGFENVVSLTNLQGRWQVMQQKPLVVMDTAHNKAGIEYIARQLRAQKYEKLHIVIGMVNDKDITGVLSLLPKDAEYYFTAAQIERALSAEKLKMQAEDAGLSGNEYSTVNLAVNTALLHAGENDIVYIGGSNFVVGEAMILFDKTNQL